MLLSLEKLPKEVNLNQTLKDGKLGVWNEGDGKQ